MIEFVILFFLINCVNYNLSIIKKKRNSGPNNNISNIKSQIKWVDLDILTITKVECNNFEVYFKNDYRQKTLDHSFIIELKNYLTQIKKYPLGNLPVDTRYKITVKSNDSLLIICGNRFHIEINGTTYKINSQFLKWLNKYINNYWEDI